MTFFVKGRKLVGANGESTDLWHGVSRLFLRARLEVFMLLFILLGLCLGLIISNTSQAGTGHLLMLNPAVNQPTEILSAVQAQLEFQAIIHRSQHPWLYRETDSAGNHSQHANYCDGERLLIRGGGLKLAKDGFASSLQYVARLLQMGVATNRVLVLTNHWRSAYEPAQCAEQLEKNHPNKSLSAWTCLWEPITWCQYDEDESKVVTLAESAHSRLLPRANNEQSDVHWNPARRGIINPGANSQFFDTTYYGSNLIVRAPNSFPARTSATQYADVIPHYERMYGRYWVRSQMVHYLWRPNAGLRDAIDQQCPPELRGNERPFIGFHIRRTDNIADFAKGFNRDTNATRTVERFMEQAQAIRRRASNDGVEILLIYVATDNAEVIKECQTNQQYKEQGWKFVFLPEGGQVQRSSGTQRNWFRQGRSAAAVGIVADLDILRRADYLVGSFQSNVYRMAAELNTAFHVGNYSSHLKRHFTVDVEWYEDP
jgi:Alpha-(1,6)-fucosyltransferase N- and catalytic domains